MSQLVATVRAVETLRQRVNGLQAWQLWLDAIERQHGPMYRIRAERLRREELARKGGKV